MFQRCSDDKEYEQAIGIALESRRLDVVKTMIERGSPKKLLPYVLEVCMTLVQNLEFRNQVCLLSPVSIVPQQQSNFFHQVLRLLVSLYHDLQEPDYISISQCLVHLNDASACTDMLKNLIEKGEEVSGTRDLDV